MPSVTVPWLGKGVGGRKKEKRKDKKLDKMNHVERVDGLEKPMKTMLILSYLHSITYPEQAISYTVIEPHLPMDRSWRITLCFEFAVSKRGATVGPVV